MAVEILDATGPAGRVAGREPRGPVVTDSNAEGGELERPSVKRPLVAERKKAGVATPSEKISEGRARTAAAEAVTGKPGRWGSLNKVAEVKRAAEDEATPEPVREVAVQALAEIWASQARSPSASVQLLDDRGGPQGPTSRQGMASGGQRSHRGFGLRLSMDRSI